MANHLPRLDYFGWIGITIKVPDISDQDYQWSELSVDFDFPKVFNLELLTGRDFIAENPADSDACLINEAAINNLGIDITEAVGLRIEEAQTQEDFNSDWCGQGFSLQIHTSGYWTIKNYAPGPTRLIKLFM